MCCQVTFFRCCISAWYHTDQILSWAQWIGFISGWYIPNIFFGPHSNAGLRRAVVCFYVKKMARIWMRAQGLVYKNKHFSNILLVVVRPKPRPSGLFLAWKGLKQKRPKPQRSFNSYVRRSVLRLARIWMRARGLLGYGLYEGPHSNAGQKIFGILGMPFLSQDNKESLRYCW